MESCDTMDACHILFEGLDPITPSSLDTLKIDDIKSIYRKKLFQYHPDLYTGESKEVIEEKKNYFIKLVEAYEIIINHLTNKKEDPHFYNKKVFKKDKSKTSKDYKNKCIFVPKRKLKFAEFLYYNGIINWRTYIRAINWQKTTRDKIGEIALRWNYIDEEELYFILENKKLDELTGQLMVKYGLISLFQLKMLLYHQRKKQLKIGNYFIINRILSLKALKYYLYKHKMYNLNL